MKRVSKEKFAKLIDEYAAKLLTPEKMEPSVLARKMAKAFGVGYTLVEPCVCARPGCGKRFTPASPKNKLCSRKCGNSTRQIRFKAKHGKIA
jgi:hypothetical protein